MSDSSKKVILIVDDDRVMQRLVQYALSGTGCETIVVSSGAAAIAYAGERKVDLAVVDLMMEEMDGFETAQALRKIPDNVELPIVMLTARGQSETRSTAEQKGISCFLNKPFSPAELAGRVKELLGIN